MKNKQQGFTLIYVVLVVSIIVMVSIVSFSASTANSIEANRNLINKKRSYYIATSCLEKSLLEIKKDSSLSGEGYYDIEGNNCTYKIIDQGVENKKIEISSNISGNISRLECLIDQINPQINITSLKEVNNFN